MRRVSTIIALALCALLYVSISSAQQTSTAATAATTATTSVPNLIRYSGTLKDAQGAALASTTPIGVTFAIYNQQDGGAPVWQETQNVTLDANGQYSVILGSTTATGLPDDLFSQQDQRWLSVQVQGEAEQARVLLVSVPYAFKAHEADTLGGLPPSAFLKAETTNDANGTSASTGSSTVTSGNNAASTGVPAVLPPITPTNTIGKFFAPGFCCKGANMVEIVGRLNVSEPINLTLLNYGYQVVGVDVLAQHNGANVVVGFHACPTPNNTRGTDIENTCVGQSAGQNDTSGGSNTFAGYQAGIANTSGSYNSYFGSFAGTANMEGNLNTFAGYQAGQKSIGYANTFLGALAGQNNNTSFNTFVGVQAGQNNVGGAANTFVGYYAGQSNKGDNTSGYSNTFTGVAAGQGNVSGHYNTFMGYTTGYSSQGSDNTGLGVAACSGPQTGSSGNYNTCIGEDAGQITTGHDNTFTGYAAGILNSTGYLDAYFGDSAGYQNSAGNFNTYLGVYTGYSDTGSYNTFSGAGAGCNNLAAGGCLSLAVLPPPSASSFNAFYGTAAGFDNTTGNTNTFVGVGSGFNNQSGSDNVFLGLEAGVNNITGNNDIYIGEASGNPLSTKENSTIRIGVGQTATYVAGIYNSTATPTPPIQVVCVDSVGLLYGATYTTGCTSSSRRFKEQITDMGDSSSKLLQLRPVTFFYKPQYDDGSHLLQYGLIAEEVAKVYPEMVAYGKDGQPYTVKYQLLAPMLLNELQKQHTLVAEQQDVIKGQQGQMQAQQQQIEEMQQRLSRLEALVAGK